MNDRIDRVVQTAEEFNEWTSRHAITIAAINWICALILVWRFGVSGEPLQAVVALLLALFALDWMRRAATPEEDDGDEDDPLHS